MSVTLGPPRRPLPPTNAGVAPIAQRRLEEAAGRSAERTRVAVSVDAHRCRLWLRNPRGTVRCPCSDSSETSASGFPRQAEVLLVPGEGDELGLVDDGYARDVSPTALPGEQLPSGPNDGLGWVGDVMKLLLGQGRRCALCWGTGWLDGYGLWGGERLLFCAADTPSVSLVDGDVDVDPDGVTPTMVGPGVVEWAVNSPLAYRSLDAFRVRCGAGPAATIGWNLNGRFSSTDAWTPIETLFSAGAFGLQPGRALPSGSAAGLQLQLTLDDDARVSHVEMVVRHSPLVCMQLPQLQLSASAELVAPVLSEEFELDPVVGEVLRGSIIEVPGLDGRVGSVWMVTDTLIKRTALGQIFGVTGSVRNVQPTEIAAVASMEDALATGVPDPGVSTRGMEPSLAGQSAGLEPGSTDSTTGAVARGAPPRIGGGTSGPYTPGSSILLSNGEVDPEGF